MLKTSSISNKMTRSIVNFCLKSVYFTCILVLSVSLIFIMTRQISAKKSAVNEKKVRELKIEATPISVVNFEGIPSQLKNIVKFSGVASPWITLDVMSLVKGVAVKKIVESGGWVKKGDLLAMIDPRDYQNEYASAKSAHDSALKTKKQVTAWAKKQFVTQSQVDEAVKVHGDL